MCASAAGWRRAISSRSIHGADVVRFASLRDFGGTALLEAMAAGLPSVIADYGGPGEHATDETSIMVAVASRAALVEGVAHAIRLLSGEPQRRRRMSTAAIEHAREYEWSLTHLGLPADPPCPSPACTPD